MEYSGFKVDITPLVGGGYEVSLKPVPEPTTMLLLGFGLLGLAGYGIRRKKKNS